MVKHLNWDNREHTKYYLLISAHYMGIMKLREKKRTGEGDKVGFLVNLSYVCRKQFELQRFLSMSSTD